MENMQFNDYLENYIESLKNKNDKLKARFFLNCLRYDFGEAALINPDIFGIIDKDYLLKSLDDYLSNSPSKQAAGDYRRTILALCETVCNNYKLINDFLLSVPEKNDFENNARDMIALLRPPERRECMSHDDYEKLIEEIRAFYNTKNLEEEIEKSISIENYKPNHYGRLVSALALELVQKYGLSNETIPSLNISDLCLQDRILQVESFRLPIDDGLAQNFALYLKSRQLIIENTSAQTQRLFIKKNGTHYLDTNGYPDASQLFLLMKYALDHTTTAKLRYKTITELVLKGANINLLSQLTKVKVKRIAELCVGSPSELETIFKANDTRPLRPRVRVKGQMQCPFCGNSNDACSENWILIQVSGDEKKYLACRECRGLDGKYRY